MKKTILAMLPALALFAFGCSDEVQKFGDSADGTFVWHGIVRDGKTGAYINFFTNVDSDTGVDKNDKDDNSSTNQVWALAAGEIRTGKPCKQEDTSAGLAQGCFYVDGLPLDNDDNDNIPVFARHSGYHEFSAELTSAESTHEPDDDNCDNDGCARSGLLFINEPQIIGNIRLFPTGTNYDYTVHATFNDRGIEGIVVRCIATDDNNEFDVLNAGNADLDSFLNPNTNTQPVITATTDTNGNATIPGSSLTKGAEYECLGHGTDVINGTVLSCDDACGIQFTVGIDDPLQEMVMNVDNGELSAIWSNIDDPENAIGAAGPVTIILNRPASVLTGTADCQGGNVLSALPDATPPVLVAPVDDDDSESVTVSLDAQGTTLSIVPLYTTAISNDFFVDFTFGGIYLQPSDAGINGDTVYRLGTSASVGTAAHTLTTLAGTCGGTIDALPPTDLQSQTVGGAQPVTGSLVN